MSHATLKSKLKDFTRLLVLGIGNELRGDDGAGIELARQLKRQTGLSKEVSVVEGGVAPENFTWIIRSFNPSHVLIVDAAEMGMPAGSIRIVGKEEIDSLDFSTHNLSLSFFASYLEKEFSSRVTIVGIEPSNSDFGKGISKPVMKSLSLLVRILLDILSKSPKC